MKRREIGQIRIIEAFLSALIVFSAFAVSANFTVTQNIAKNDLASVGLQALTRLDSDGTLGKHIDDGNWTALRETLSLVLPVGVCFNLTVYDEDMRQVNTEAVSNGCFNGQNIAFVEYVCVSRNVNFSCYIIHLRLMVVT
ncbi:MAG: hypothetical protein QXI91_05440 [Candidatus Bathyarchaeia archaeon]